MRFSTKAEKQVRGARGLSLGFCVMSALALAGCVSGLQNVQGQDGSALNLIDDDEVIALLSDGTPTNRLLSAADQQGYRLLDTTSLPALGQVMLTFAKPDDVTGAQAIDALEAAESASIVGVNHAYRLQQNAQGFTQQDYARAMLDWPAQGCRANGPVGLIDTRVDPDAPALSQARIVSRQFAEVGTVSTRHGTEIASVLADPRTIDGITIYNAGVVGETSNGDTAAGADDLIRALDWLAGQDVRVVNLSLAGPFNKLLNLAVVEATQRGLVLVAAVGNAGPNVAPQYPAAFPSVIAVTAIDADRDIYRRAVRGSFVDFAAPGVDVFIPSAEGGRFVTGTSVAAPFVTMRILADEELMRSASPTQIRERLAATSEDLGRRGSDPVFGSGLPKATGLCR